MSHGDVVVFAGYMMTALRIFLHIGGFFAAVWILSELVDRMVSD